EAAPGPGEHDHPHVIAVGAVLQQVEVQRLHLRRPGVQPVRPIERQGGYPVLDVPQHDLAHPSSSSSGSNTNSTPPMRSGPSAPAAGTRSGSAFTMISVSPRSTSSALNRTPASPLRPPTPAPH